MSTEICIYAFLHCKHFKTTDMEKKTKVPMKAIICNPLSSNANIQPAFLPSTSSDSAVNLTKEQFNLELSKNYSGNMETLASEITETKIKDDDVSSTSLNIFGLHMQCDEPASLPVFSEMDKKFEDQKLSKRIFCKSKAQPHVTTSILKQSTVVDGLRGISIITEDESNFLYSTTTHQKKCDQNFQKVQSQCIECLSHTNSQTTDNTSSQEKTVQEIAPFRVATEPVHISAVSSKEERSLQSPPPKLLILSPNKNQLITEKEAYEVKNSIQSFLDDKAACFSNECVEKNLTVKKLLPQPKVFTDPSLEENEYQKPNENITCEKLYSVIKKDNEIKSKLEMFVPIRQTESEFEMKKCEKLLTPVETDLVRPKHSDYHCVETSCVNYDISGFHNVSLVECRNIKHRVTLEMLSNENSENTIPECKISGHQETLVVRESDEYEKLDTFSIVKQPEILTLEKQKFIEAPISSVKENQKEFFPDEKLCCEMTSSVTEHEEKLVLDKNEIDEMPTSSVKQHQEKLVLDKIEIDKMSTSSVKEHQEKLVLDKNEVNEMLTSLVTEHREKLVLDKNEVDEMSTSLVTEHREKLVLDKNEVDEMSTSLVTEHREKLVLDKNEVDEMSTSLVTEHQEKLVLDKNEIDEMPTSSVKEHQEKLVLDNNKIDEMSTSSVKEHQEKLVLDKNENDEMPASSVTEHQEKLVLDKNRIDEMSTSSVTEDQEKLILDKNEDEMSTSLVTKHQEKFVLDNNNIDEMTTFLFTGHHEKLVLDENDTGEMPESLGTEHQEKLVLDKNKFEIIISSFTEHKQKLVLDKNENGEVITSSVSGHQEKNFLDKNKIDEITISSVTEHEDGMINKHTTGSYIDQPRTVATALVGKSNDEQSKMEVVDSEKCDFLSLSSVSKVKEISDCLVEKEIIDHTEDQLFCPSESEISLLFDALPKLSSALETEDTDVEDEGVYNLKSLFSGKLFQQDEQKIVKKNMKKSPKKQRPNYFVAIQVSNPEVHCHIKKVQDHIVEIEKNLQLAVIPLTTLHLTLLVMHLENEEDMKRACNTLSSCYDNIKENINANPIHLEFHGLSHFQNQVLFAKVKNGKERLDCIAEAVARCFYENGLTETDETDYKAHLTIMKLSRSPKLRKKGIKHIKSSYYTEFKNSNFGIQTVHSLQLLKMARADDESGYYVFSHECKFDLPTTESDDHTHCCQSPSLKALSQNSAKKANLRVATADVKDEIKHKIHALTTASLNKAGQCEDDTSTSGGNNVVNKTGKKVK
ncbi:uncharacterized protein LOC143235475 isoform X2 [Tachypleus tridentatus]|uniref:uncharacterized protein LOC143235475 isoform X2 n=1 Tax=Tachypleus tridentatus TaxID=6853 RepID=UPI003FD3EA06